MVLHTRLRFSKLFKGVNADPVHVTRADLIQTRGARVQPLGALVQPEGRPSYQTHPEAHECSECSECSVSTSVNLFITDPDGTRVRWSNQLPSAPFILYLVKPGSVGLVRCFLIGRPEPSSTCGPSAVPSPLGLKFMTWTHTSDCTDG